MYRYHYLYRIDNIVNGKFYYGIRSCYCDPESDPYMGSGLFLMKHIKKREFRILRRL